MRPGLCAQAVPHKHAIYRSFEELYPAISTMRVQAACNRWGSVEGVFLYEFHVNYFRLACFAITDTGDHSHCCCLILGLFPVPISCTVYSFLAEMLEMSGRVMRHR
jgi:hypothetical protein